MSRSLVVRVTALVAAVITVSFLGWAVVLHRTTSRTFVDVQQEIVGREGRVDDALGAALEAAHREGGADAVRALATEPATTALAAGRDFLVLRPDLTVLAASTPALLDARVGEVADGVLHVTLSRAGRDGREELAIEIAGATELTSPAGETWGRLVVTPEPVGSAAGRRFADAVWRGAGLWLLGILALAVFATTWLLRRSLAPVDRLTRAARDLQRGAIPAPVVPSGDRELVDLVEAFNDAVATIGQTEALRRRLIADVAHELRTPVTNIQAQLEACEAGLIRPDRELLDTLRAETRLLGRLVEDVQQLAQSDAGRLDLRMQDLPLLETAANAMEPLAEAAGARLVVEPSEDAVVRLDEERFRQVLANLVENAARHGPPGLVLRLSVRVTPARATLRVADNGPGVAEADRPHIFERFYRAEPSRDRRGGGGAGLGLAIVKGLVEAMEGSIRYEPGPGGGAVFVVSLPRSDGGRPRVGGG